MRYQTMRSRSTSVLREIRALRGKKKILTGSVKSRIALRPGQHKPQPMTTRGQVRERLEDLKARYRGRAKIAAQKLTLAGRANLLIARGACLSDTPKVHLEMTEKPKKDHVNAGDPSLWKWTDDESADCFASNRKSHRRRCTLNNPQNYSARS
jgi:hypothetical protein